MAQEGGPVDDPSAIWPEGRGGVIVGRLAGGGAVTPAGVFRLELEMAQEGDPVDDPSAIWPEGRERVIVGRLEVVRPITQAELGDLPMMHDPTVVTDGIEVSPEDQIIAARRGAYLVSLAERTGGWQRLAHVDAAPAGMSTKR